MKPCIEWEGKRDKGGYGYFYVSRNGLFCMLKRGTHRAHRVAFFFANGYWPKVCRHICDNPPCIEPEHLLDGTFGDNNRDTAERGRTVQQQKTHCPQGHEYTDKNTYMATRPDGRQVRKCRTCIKVRGAARYERDKEKILAKRAAWYRNNREKVRESSARYYKENRDQILARSAERYREKTQEK